MPAYIEPLLPSLRERPPSGDDWVHEVKFDGYRFQLHIRQGQTQLFTRRGHDWTHKARNVAAAGSRLRTQSAIIDGEVAVMAPDGTTDFNELERELGKEQPARLTLYAFDVLYLNGFDLRHETLTNRKRALRTLLQDLPKDSPIQYSEHLEGDALRMKQEACRLGLEGVVTKRKDSRYISGRSDYWIKVPCRKRDTFVIVGWALKGKKFDGFYLGEEHRGELVYAGKIESGWTEEQKEDLLARARALQVSHSPLADKIDKPKAKWVKPSLLVDVEYRAKTKTSGLLRHPRFKGVREDLMEPSEKQRRQRPR